MFNSVLQPSDTDSCKSILGYILTLVAFKRSLGISRENSLEIRETGTLVKF